MNEFEFISKITKLSKHKDARGIGDDAALFGENFVIAKDILAQGVHFLKDTPLDLVLHKLFTSNISDVASMGAIPTDFLLGLALPSGVDLGLLSELIEKYTKNYDLNLIGGDTSKSLSGLFLSMTIIGRRGKYLLERGGAKDGDVLYVSRQIGLAKLSLDKMLGQNDFCNIDKFAHFMFEPELELGKMLGELGFINSCTDISDGLGLDAGNIANASGKKIIIDYNMLKKAAVAQEGVDAVDNAISSGEEFALIFSVPQKYCDELEEIIIKKLGRQIFKIGKVSNGFGCYLEKNSDLVDISKKGFEHTFSLSKD